jgi:hypothetical protein
MQSKYLADDPARYFIWLGIETPATCYGGGHGFRSADFGACACGASCPLAYRKP